MNNLCKQNCFVDNQFSQMSFGVAYKSIIQICQHYLDRIETAAIVGDVKIRK
jgi:hypothetical protein